MQTKKTGLGLKPEVIIPCNSKKQNKKEKNISNRFASPYFFLSVTALTKGTQFKSFWLPGPLSTALFYSLTLSPPTCLTLNSNTNSPPLPVLTLHPMKTLGFWYSVPFVSEAT